MKNNDTHHNETRRNSSQNNNTPIHTHTDNNNPCLICLIFKCTIKSHFAECAFCGTQQKLLLLFFQ